MADLTNSEKRSFERLFGMSSGYVLDFSNRTFDEFIADVTGKEIYDNKYDSASGSKANRLRAFWSIEPNHVVAKLLDELLTYAVELGIKPDEEPLFDKCKRTVQRLKQSASVSDIDAITPNSTERSFEEIAKAVREAIDKNEPEQGLDRLHTFVVKYMRVACQRHGISINKDKPLHSLVGEYIKRLKERGYIESEMTERILKSSISTMEAFNRVRNDQSFAHDNEALLNYDESLFIFNHVSSAIKFIEALEKRISSEEKQTPDTLKDEEIPF